MTNILKAWLLYACRIWLMLGILALGTSIATAREESPFGYRQLEQVLDDRPEMKGFFAIDSETYKWVVRQFNSDCIGERVHWDWQEPYSGRQAENQLPYESIPALIRITSSKKISGRDKWLMLVFEMYNLSNVKQYKALDDKAAMGQIDRAEYSKACVALEDQAALQTIDFFRRHPIPDASDKDYYYTLFMNPSSRPKDDALRSLDAGYDPLEYFGEHFDTLPKQQYADWGTWFRDLKSERDSQK